MKVLGLASYPVEAAATRYRLQQFVGPLAERGLTLTIRPFLSSSTFATFYQRRAFARTALTLLKSALMRLSDVALLKQSDVVLLQREAMIFGPPVFEWLAVRVFKRPLVLEVDNRAKEIARDTGFPTAPRGDFAAISRWIAGSSPLHIRINSAAIGQWREQFRAGGPNSP